jgi:hypothetical protein
LGIVTFSGFKSEQFTKFMAIKIFSLRHNLCLFIGAFLILGLIPNSVNAFSDENGSDIQYETIPGREEVEEEEGEGEEEAETPPIDQTENTGPPADGQEPENETPVGEIEESPGETETTDLVTPTPTIEAGPDINQPNFQESAAETEGETAVEIPGEPGQEATSTTTEDSPGDAGQSTSGPAVNPPIEPPSGEFTFPPEVTSAVNETAGDIIDQLSSPTGELGISGGDLGAAAGGGDSAIQNIQNILTGSSIDSANLNVLVQGLLQILGAPSREVAEQLVRSLLGLLKDGKVEPRRLWAAINAYNAFIQASSPEFLENPPIELVMIRAILSDLVEAAIAADIRSRN